MGETGSELSAVPNVNPEQPIQESGLSGQETLSLISRLLDSKLDKKFSEFKRGLEQKELATNTHVSRKADQLWKQWHCFL